MSDLVPKPDYLTEKMSDKIYLIDGHALVFKMYYALLRHPMINSKGVDTSILFGFTKYILELIEREKPTHFAVAFDPPGGTFRNNLYPEYKANRDATPQPVIDALEPLIEICKGLNIQVLMVPGYEADDVIGTVARNCKEAGIQVNMVTPDKDYGQLVCDGITQIRPGKAGGQDELLDKKGICDKFGISDPGQVIEMLTICGDTADNVPGVKGVGEVGAAKLISKYGNVENIYAHLDELSEKQRAMFEQARDHIALSHDLVTIRTDVPVEVSPEQLRRDSQYSPRAFELFKEYEFPSLMKYLGTGASALEESRKSLEVKDVTVAEILSLAEKTELVALSCETFEENIFSQVRRMTVAVEDCVAVGTPDQFKALLEDETVEKCGFNLKHQLNALKNNDITLRGRLSDIEVMHYILDPERSHKPDQLAKGYLGVELSREEDSQLSLFEKEESPSLKLETAASYLLKGKLREELEAARLSSLYDNVEEALIRVLARMEYSGVKVDIAQLKDFASGLRKEIADREKTIREMADEPQLNVSSPKQVGVLLFEKLKLDPKAKKGGSLDRYSTDEATLTAIAHKHPIVGEILEFRAAKKLLSTYIEPFPTLVSPRSGKIHTTFNQALTATGRLSSSGPNLQNIPIRTERGKEIRKAFVPSDPGGCILSADYSQIELRIMAHLSGDEHMIRAFSQGEDVHKMTAAKIFGIDPHEVTSDQRRIAKTANFGIMYGISAFGLAQRLDVSRPQAKKIIDDYFEAFPTVQTYISETVEKARKDGYVETLFGRRRYLPDINAKNATVRGLAERNAVNAPIQGTSADIIKIAMIGVQRRMDENGLKSRMVLQIHDELLFDVVPGEQEVLREIVTEEMENVIKLRIPLTVECNYGKNWLEAH